MNSLAITMIHCQIGTNRYIINTISIQNPYHGSLGGADGVHIKLLSALSARRLPQAQARLSIAGTFLSSLAEA
jgi:hypothetical protein